MDQRSPREVEYERLRERLAAQTFGRAPLLWSLINAGSFRAIETAVPFFLSHDPDERREAISLVANRFAEMTGKTIYHLSERRWWPTFPGCDDRYFFQAKHLSKFDLDTERCVYQFATFHWNGYVRQAALDALTKAPRAEDWPFVFLRVTDWVGRIRKQASESHLKMLVPVNGEVIMRHHMLFGLLERKPSVRIEEALDFAAGLVDPTEWPRLDPAFRRLVAERMVRTDPEAWEMLLADTDPFVEGVAVKVALQSGRTDALRRLWKAARASTRRIALDALVELDAASARPELMQALIDENWRVRAHARFYIDKQGGMDYRDFYLEQVSSRPLPGSVEGLAETGLPVQAALLVPFLFSPSVPMRISALKAIRHLDSSLIATHAERLMQDTNRKIRRATAELIGGNRTAFPVPARVALFESDDAAKRRVGAMLLIALPTWDAVGWLLCLCTHHDPEMRALGSKALRRWLEKAHMWKPSPEQLEQARAMRGECPDAALGGMVRELDSALGLT